MSWLTTLVGGGGVTPAIDAVGGALDELFTSDEETLTKKEAMLRLAVKSQAISTKIGMIEAQSKHWFVAAARPSLMWAISVTVLMVFAVGPMLFWSIEVYSAISSGTPIPPPSWPAMDNFWALIPMVLGYQAARTTEKLNGSAR
jgi:hypothetical protein